MTSTGLAHGKYGSQLEWRVIVSCSFQVSSSHGIAAYFIERMYDEIGICRLKCGVIIVSSHTKRVHST